MACDGDMISATDATRCARGTFGSHMSLRDFSTSAGAFCTEMRRYCTNLLIPRVWAHAKVFQTHHTITLDPICAMPVCVGCSL